MHTSASVPIPAFCLSSVHLVTQLFGENNGMADQLKNMSLETLLIHADRGCNQTSAVAAQSIRRQISLEIHRKTFLSAPAALAIPSSAGKDPVRRGQIRRSLPGAIQDQELMLEQKRLGNDGTGTARSEQASQGSDEMDEKDDHRAGRSMEAEEPEMK